MADRVASHYSENLRLADAIADKLRNAGKDLNRLTTADLVTADEFHIRGRKATLELGVKNEFERSLGCSRHRQRLGGPALTLAEAYGCQVTGIDLTQHSATRQPQCPIGSASAAACHSSKGTRKTFPSTAGHSMRR